MISIYKDMIVFPKYYICVKALYSLFLKISRLVAFTDDQKVKSSLNLQHKIIILLVKCTKFLFNSISDNTV